MLETDEKGNLYLYKTALLCKNDIIKRLISGKYQLEDPGITGKCHIPENGLSFNFRGQISLGLISLSLKKSFKELVTNTLLA